MDGLPTDYNSNGKENDFRKIMYKASAELGDGDSRCTFETAEELCAAIKEFAQNYNNPGDAGGSFSVELVALTAAEFDALPEL